MTTGMGQLLRAVREGAGLTQQELADRLGITQAAISQTENSDDSMTIGTATRYLAALGYHIEIWMHGEPNSGSIRLSDMQGG